MIFAWDATDEPPREVSVLTLACGVDEPVRVEVGATSHRFRVMSYSRDIPDGRAEFVLVRLEEE